MPRIGFLTNMEEELGINDTPVWRIYKNDDGSIGPVLYAWYTDHQEHRFLITRTFSTKVEAQIWIEDFWQAYWQLSSHA